MISIQSFIKYLEERIIEHESKHCKCENENEAITICDDRLKDPLLYMIDKYLSIGEKFSLILVSKHFNQLISDTDKQKFKKYYRCNKYSLEKAVVSKDLEIMKWIIKNGCPLDECIFEIAAFFGDLEIMKWLLEKECPWNENTCESAIQNGDLENITWLKKMVVLGMVIIMMMMIIIIMTNYNEFELILINFLNNKLNV